MEHDPIRVPAPAPASIDSLLAELERDMAPEVGAAFAAVVARYFAETGTGRGPVSTRATAAELAARFSEPLPSTPKPLAEVIDRLERDVIPESNRLMHPRSMGHQVSAPLPAAVWTETLTGALNQSGAVWEMSPVGSIIEHRVIQWMADLAGLGPDAGGTFTSGGTEATFAALLAARHAACPDAWRQGVGDRPPAVICGEHAHYGVARAVGELGLGTDHIVTIPSRGFVMDEVSLERTLAAHRAEDAPVMAVVATAGSTATGAFDDLDTIGRLCERFGVWLHVDGAHGASALLSPTHRQRLSGLHRASSVAWDPHKMMLMPLSASVVLVRREADLEAAFSQRAPYLFHGRDGERNWDQGLRTFQCSRRIDALKVWVALQRYGAEALGALYDALCDTARTFYRRIEAHPQFEAVHEPQSNILCFRYIGDGSAGPATVDDLNLRLRTALNRRGDGWITTTVLGGRRVLRVTVMNPRTTADDVEHVIASLSAIGQELRAAS